MSASGAEGKQQWALTLKVGEDSWAVPVQCTEKISVLRAKCTDRVRRYWEQDGKSVEGFQLSVLRREAKGAPGPILDDEDTVGSILHHEAVIYATVRQSAVAAAPAPPPPYAHVPDLAPAPPKPAGNDNKQSASKRARVPPVPKAEMSDDEDQAQQKNEQAVAGPPGGCSIFLLPEKPKNPWPMDIKVKTEDGTMLSLRVPATVTCHDLMIVIAQRMEWDECSPPRLFLAGNRLLAGHTMAEIGIQPESIIYAVRSQTGGKPVILFYPPRPTDITCHLSLSRQWTFSALYPRVNSASAPLPKHEAKWSITAQPNGQLQDHFTGRQFDYLFWEAEHLRANGDMFPQPLEHSFCVPGGQAAGDWLDMALERLGLNTRERNDMVTFWLPSLSANRYNVISFLTAEEYNAAARLSISPQPDVLLRVFMLFRGVDEPVAGCKGQLPNKPLERKGFVVVEWGAMNLDGGL